MLVERYQWPHWLRRITRWKDKRKPKAKIAFLCDVDDRQAVESKRISRTLSITKDYRVMLDKEAKNIDAVSVSHQITCTVYKLWPLWFVGKHVYVQNRSRMIYTKLECWLRLQKYKVVTQMGNQYASADYVRMAKEYVDAGLIGDVHTVHLDLGIARCGRKGIAWPTTKADVPKELDWDLWQGTAKPRLHSESSSFQLAWLVAVWNRRWATCLVISWMPRLDSSDWLSFEVECSSTTAWSDFSKKPLCR